VRRVFITTMRPAAGLFAFHPGWSDSETCDSHLPRNAAEQPQLAQIRKASDRRVVGELEQLADKDGDFAKSGTLPPVIKEGIYEI